jgi:hypothetical protein
MAKLPNMTIGENADDASRLLVLLRIGLLLLLVGVLAGCASEPLGQSRRDASDPVAMTLQSYQTGKTTFADFKRDAGLETAGLPATLVSYRGASEVSRIYLTAPASPWRIYKRGDYLTVNDWRVGHLWQFAVGNAHQVISVLTFNGRGQLVSIAPVTIADLARSSDLVMAPTN